MNDIPKFIMLMIPGIGLGVGIILYTLAYWIRNENKKEE